MFINLLVLLSFSANGFSILMVTCFIFSPPGIINSKTEMLKVDSSTIALIISLIVNAAQFVESLFKDYNDRMVQEKKLNNEKEEKEAQRKHEIETMEIKESIYRSHQVIPEARKVCLEYIGATETELARTDLLPVNFSRQQEILETKVILYIPGARQTIENFKEDNSPELGGGIVQFKYEFRNNVIPAIANELENFQPGKK